MEFLRTPFGLIPVFEGTPGALSASEVQAQFPDAVIPGGGPIAGGAPPEAAPNPLPPPPSTPPPPIVEPPPDPEKEVIPPATIDPPEEGPDMILWVCDKEGFAPSYETTMNPGAADGLMALGWSCRRLPHPVPDVPGERARIFQDFFGGVGIPGNEGPPVLHTSVDFVPPPASPTVMDSIHWPVLGLLILAARFV